MFDKTKRCTHPSVTVVNRSGNDFCEQEVIIATLARSCGIADAGNSRRVQDFVRSVLNAVTSLQSNAENEDRSMNYRKHGVRIESCFKETALKDVEASIELSRYR